MREAGSNRMREGNGKRDGERQERKPERKEKEEEVEEAKEEKEKEERGGIVREGVKEQYSYIYVCTYVRMYICNHLKARCTQWPATPGPGRIYPPHGGRVGAKRLTNYKYFCGSKKVLIIGTELIEMTSGTSARVTRPNGSPSTTASAGMTQTHPNWACNYHRCSPANTRPVSSTMSIFAPNMLPGWIIGWFIFTAIICTWDASFIMLRPLSFPGQSLSSVWYPCKYWIFFY